jgi:uncharacterized protein involved in response to NO
VASVLLAAAAAGIAYRGVPIGGSMSSTAKRIRAWGGPAILSYGFRPMFLGAGAWAAIAMSLWIAMLAGALSPPTRFAFVDWHAHELLFGFLPAVLAGFLLTAVPNWTGRLPVVGWPLLTLWAIWCAGRVAVLFSALLPPGAAAVVDLSFLVALASVIGREIVAARNHRNLGVLVAVLLLLAANVLFHLDAAGGAAAHGPGARLAIAVGVFLITLVGGRIVPSFTGNWLARRGGSLPAAFGVADRLALAAGVLALIAWVAAPGAAASGALCLAAGLLNLARLARWNGVSTAAEPLILILHLGFLFVPVGFLFAGGAALAPEVVPVSAAVHAWTAGAIGVMTLAVMTRASLGHTGRPLSAGGREVAIYAFALGAAGLRIAGALVPGTVALLYVSALLWILAFGGFALGFLQVLACPKLAPKVPNRAVAASR